MWEVKVFNWVLILLKIYRGVAWEDQFLDTVGYYEDSGYFKHIAVARFASRTLDHELEKNTRTVIPYFGSTFILMAVFRYKKNSFFSVIFCMLQKRVFFFDNKIIFLQRAYMYDGRHSSLKAMAWTFG